MKIKKRTRKPCVLTLCEDPKTGKFVVASQGKCPAGWLRKEKERVLRQGVEVLFPAGDE